MRAPALVGIITALHILGVTAFVFIQGCGMTRPVVHTTSRVEPPPPPVMPPKPRTQEELKWKRPVSVPSSPAVSGPTEFNSYTIQKGQTLSHVAKLFHVSSRELAELNNLTNPDQLDVGQIIRIPPQAKKDARSIASMPSLPPTFPTEAPSSSDSASRGKYVVQVGDSLSKIARKYGVEVNDLMKANGLSSDRILIGQRLTIPPGSQGFNPASVTSHSIQPPSRAASSSSPTLRADEINARSLQAGDGVVISDIDLPSDASMKTFSPAMSTPSDVMDIAPPQNKPIPYTVVEGDNLEEIAKLFIVNKEEIMILNGLGSDDALAPGQTIMIPPSAL